MADKMAAESEISDYFKNQQSKGWYHPLMGHFYTHESICKQSLLFTTFEFGIQAGSRLNQKYQYFSLWRS